MIQSKQLAALVPMRHHSIRVPGKNYRLLAGEPLYSYILKTLLSCPEIAKSIVDTDSPIIQEGVERDFPTVQLINRPEDLRGSTVPMNDVIMHDVTQIPADVYLQTHSTNPLLRPETVRRAIRKFMESYPEHDSLFSVTRIHSRFWDGLTRAINQNPSFLFLTYY